MRHWKWIWLAVGLGLFALTLAEADLVEVGGRLANVGIAGALFVVALYFLAGLAVTWAWWLTFEGAAPKPFSFWPLWRVRMIGEAFNRVVPAASFGGEPIKAMLLKSHYGIAYQDSTASIVLFKTLQLFALILFLIAGFAAMSRVDWLSSTERAIATTGLIALTAGVGGFFVVQRFRVTSLLIGAFRRTRDGTVLARVEATARAIDQRLVYFYRHRPGAFVGVFLLTLLNWCLNLVEIFVIFHLLGIPISIQDALIVEAGVQLVRAGTFFIPANIGSQEGAFVIAVTALTGDASLALTIAAVRRARGLAWIVWGLALGWTWGLNPLRAKSEVGANERQQGGGRASDARNAGE